MTPRRNEYDVTNQVDTTSPTAVGQEVCRIFRERYPDASDGVLQSTFKDCTRLYQGEYPGYHACDTLYHNLQHILDVTLAMARLMDGYERTRNGSEAIGARLFGLGVICALFHDIGYLRLKNDTRHQNGAEYTLSHVSRGARFLGHYVAKAGMPEFAPVAAQLVHFTGYEIPISEIAVPSAVLRLLGNMLGTADILAQMSDRCYLEKCRDRLYPEFVAGGLAASGQVGRLGGTQFSSAEDLLRKTPSFYQVAQHRLNYTLGGVYHYALAHFGTQNLYLEEVLKNVRHAERVAQRGGTRGLLRRALPDETTPFEEK